MESVKIQYLSTLIYQRRRVRTQSGQSLLIALAVLFLLGFLGALFATIVVRNLNNAQTANDTINTDYFAQAGINYANTMLETSPLGADWRPPLQYTDSTQFPVTSSTAGLSGAPPNDPDYKWLNAGFTRYNLNGGRFLLKVIYNPSGATAALNGVSVSTTAKYLEIDSVGRIGVIDSNDPTTYTTNPPDLRRSELIAYKPIGIVDYSRFITDKDNRTDTANLGVPSVVSTTGSQPIVTPGVYDFDPKNLPSADPQAATEYPLTTTYGSSTAYAGLVAPTVTTVSQIGGGTLRSNMNLRLYGLNNVYLNTAFGDDWEVAGNLTLDQYNSTTASTAYTTGLPAQLQINVPDATTPTSTDTDEVYPSNSVDTLNNPNFDTYSGAVRDGSTDPDVHGAPRSIRRLDPPLIDTVDSATGLTRYQTLTGGVELQPQNYLNTPATVYISNSSDIQEESLNQTGGYTLRGDWLNPTASNTSGNWVGGFYNPPGALITFGPLSGAVSTGGTTPTYPYGITLTRSDVDSSGAPVPWTTPGTPVSPIPSQTLKLLYAPPPSATTVNPDGTGVGYLQTYGEPTTSTGPTDPTDVVIYASGNVRIRGILSDPNVANGAPVHITIVTNGIAYIDGSILKGNPGSSIAILARQYVCLNTTQFLAGATNLNASVTGVTGTAGPPPALTFSGAETLDEEGLYEQWGGAATTLYNGASYNYALYYSSSTSSSSSQPSEGDVQTDHSGVPYELSPQVTGSTPVRNVISLPVTITGPPTGVLTAPTSDVPFTLTFNKDSTQAGDWLLQKAAILPGDIKIQAVLYAQNDSFFVIPGDWFNTDPSDTITHAFARLVDNPQTLDARYPFYGQPIDLQISVIGAVSENIPADISDESAWMQKWGWIPRYHGFTVGSPQESPHAVTPLGGVVQLGIGLNFSYDPAVGFPYTVSTGGAVAYLRQDQYGRALPFAPSLPVSPDLLYSGQPTT